MNYVILEKSQVRGFTRTRRGKLERVASFIREGDKKVCKGFHVTSKENVEKIKHEGFKPTEGTDGLYGVYIWAKVKDAKSWLSDRSKVILNVTANVKKVIKKDKLDKLGLYDTYSIFMNRSDSDVKTLLSYPEYKNRKKEILDYIDGFKKLEVRNFHRFRTMVLQKMGYDAVEGIWDNSLVILDPSKVKVVK